MILSNFFPFPPVVCLSDVALSLQLKKVLRSHWQTRPFDRIKPLKKLSLKHKLSITPSSSSLSKHKFRLSNSHAAAVRKYTHISTHSHWLWQSDWRRSLFILSLCQGWPVTRAGRRGCTGCRWTTSHVSQSWTHSHPAGRLVYWTGVTAGRGSESIHWTEQTVSALLSIHDPKYVLNGPL